MITDSHIHLARLPHYEDLAQILVQKGCEFVNIACEPWEWEIAEKHPRWKSAFGIHPMIATSITAENLTLLRPLLERHPSAQVGEAGLDKRFPGYEPGGIQEQIFRKQVQLAIDLDRDIQIHCVGDYGRIIQILKQEGFGNKATAVPIFHRFGGDSSIVKAGLALGAKFSIHTDSFRKKSTAEALQIIPCESILFETDADESFFEKQEFIDIENAVSEIVNKLTTTELSLKKAQHPACDSSGVRNK